jgi:chromosome segregation ATPase
MSAKSESMTSRITKKELIAMDRTACSVRGVLDNLRTQLQILDDEIKADLRSKAEYDRQLAILETRKDDLRNRVKQNTEWLNVYDVGVGPFAERYKNMTADIAILYSK